ncbi:stage II sporulation protein M [Candidatus Pyrohabitans sp.]
MFQLGKNNIINSIVIWYLAFIFGMLISYFTNVSVDYLKFIKKNYNIEPIFSNILIHNFEITAILVLGSLTLSVLTIFGIFLNGFATGSIIITYSAVVPLYILCFLILPHGIFEFPSIWLAGAAGLKGSQVFLRYLRGGEFVTREDIKEYLTLSALSVVLIVIAAWVEANITLKIAERLLS